MKRLLYLATILTIIGGSFPLQARALSQSQLDVLNSGVYYFDSEDTNTSCSTDLAGNSNEEKVWNYFRSKLEAKQTAALMGNFSVESGFNPKSYNPSTTTDNPDPSRAFGLVQWNDGRQTSLRALADKRKLPITDLGVQLDFAWSELTGSYSSSVLDPIKNSDDLATMVQIVNLHYEVSGTDDKPRLDAATRILTDYGSSDSDLTTSSLSCDSDGGSVQLDPNFSMIKLSPFLASPGGQITPKGITLHWWGSGSGGRGINTLVSALRGNSSCGAGGCSVQIGITADGKIYQMTKNLTDLTYHAIGANQTTFGIEIEGSPADFGQAGIDKYPQKFSAVVATVKYLIAKYKLPITGPATCGDVSGVHPHSDYNSCPGALFKDDIDSVYFNAVMQKVRQ
jgi:hypothetical protein